jgi:hypothetical protein
MVQQLAQKVREYINIYAVGWRQLSSTEGEVNDTGDQGYIHRLKVVEKVIVLELLWNNYFTLSLC